MTKKEFVEDYAKRSNLTVQELKHYGLIAVPCDENCDYEKCRGWKMTSQQATTPTTPESPRDQQTTK